GGGGPAPGAGGALRRRRAAPRAGAAGAHNVLYPMKEALRARATVGEVCGTLREVWGRYEPSDTF
ncbi:hypothetical protein ACFXDP_19675, partial [Streptomyces sp. NPDC059374]